MIYILIYLFIKNVIYLEMFCWSMQLYLFWTYMPAVVLAPIDDEAITITLTS